MKPMFRMFTAVAIAATACVATAPAQTPGVLPTVTQDDNGHYAFVRAVIPALLGRRAMNAEEVKVLGDIAALSGRRAVVEMLMTRPAFTDYWTHTMMDLLQYQRRVGDNSIRRQNNGCFDAPLRSVPDGGDLARFVRSQPPDTSVTPPDANPSTPANEPEPWNMNDLVRSAIADDNLSSIYLAYMFPLTTHPGREFNERLKRDGVGTEFAKLYLTRTIGCLTCHNEQTSTTGEGSGWNRLHAIPYSIDQSLFGSNFGSNTEQVFNVFRSDGRAAFSDANKIIPWGMADACTRKTEQTNVLGFKPTSSDANAQVSFADLSGTDKDVLDLSQSLREGMNVLNASGLTVSGQQNGPPLPNDARAAFAYQTAVSTVDRIWDHVMGNPLTIALNFPRNPDQRDALWRLTEDVFITHDWSLKRVLSEIVLSDYFNRRAPDRSLDTDKYPMRMLFDPWVADDPRDSDSGPDGADQNGQGELIRQLSPQGVVRAFSTAMGWRMPDVRPESGSSYARLELMRAIGQYLTQNEAGADTMGFQGLLQWETTLSNCSKPAGTGDDWIDKLVDAKDGDSTWRPSLADMIEALKDRLTGNGRIAEVPPADVALSERDALSMLYGRAVGAGGSVDLNTDAADYTDTTLTNGLRRICATIAKSPQFLYNGLQTRTTLHRPRLEICLDGEDCGYTAICETARTELGAMNVRVGCLSDDVYEPPAPRRTGPIVFCPNGLCDLVPEDKYRVCLGGIRPAIEGILEGLRDCKPQGPDLACDPRCGTAFAGGFSPMLDGEFVGFGGGRPLPDGGDPLGGGTLGLRCCGGLDPVNPGFGRNVLAWAEGARVRDVVDGILIRPSSGGEAVLPLEPGMDLRAGDVIVLGPKASVQATLPGVGTFEAQGAPARNSFDQRSERAIDKLLIEAMAREDMVLSTLLIEKGANPSVLARDGVLKLATDLGVSPGPSISIARPTSPGLSLGTSGALRGGDLSDGLTVVRPRPDTGIEAIFTARDRSLLGQRLGGLLSGSETTAGEALFFRVTGPSDAAAFSELSLTRGQVIADMVKRATAAEPYDTKEGLERDIGFGHNRRLGNGGITMDPKLAVENGDLLEKLGKTESGIR